MALASLALLASPAAGSSLFGPGPAGKGGKVVRFTARGSHGYKISVYAPLGPRSQVAINVESRKGGAQYVATGLATTTRVRASFGRLGRISMRFRPSGETLRSHIQGDKQCPYPATARSGTFVGSFRFSGEGGYISVDVHKVEGGVGAPTAPFDKKEELDLGCHQEEKLAEPVLPTTLPLPTSGEELAPGGLTLYAVAPTVTGAIFVGAGPTLLNGAPTNPASTIVIALDQEEVEGIRIGRAVFGGGPSSQVLPDRGWLIGATLTPGAPFTGSATYNVGPNGIGTLAGDLGVPMLGAGTVALAGPTFQASLSEGTS